MAFRFFPNRQGSDDGAEEECEDDESGCSVAEGREAGAGFDSEGEEEEHEGSP